MRSEMIRIHASLFLLLLAMASLLNACTVGTDFRAPPAPTVQPCTADTPVTLTVASTGPSGVAQHFDQTMAIPA